MAKKDYLVESEELEEIEEVTAATIKASLMPKSDDELPIPVRFRGITQGLFFEYRFQSTIEDLPAPYTLMEHDHELNGITYLSMYKIYMTCDSDYEAAMTILGSYPHWQKLRKCNWFKPYIEKWEEERDIRDEAIARKLLIREAENGNVTAARTLYANSTEKRKPSRGRPPKGGQRLQESPEEGLELMFQRAEEASNKKYQ